MQENSSPVKPAALGAIGKDHIAHCFASLGCVEDSFQYRKVMWTDEDGLPSIVEVAFGWRGEEDAGDYSNFENRRIITGVNWSPGIINPFRRLTSDSMYEVGLSSILEDLEAGPEEPIVFFLHYVNPRVQYTDRGKSAVVLNSESSDKIVKAVKAVTSKWTKQRKAEERGRSKVSRRDAVARKSSNVTQVEAARIVMPRAYMKASGNGTLPASVRQIMYAARGAILRLSSTSHLSASYFSQTLLPNYLAENPTTTKGWDVVYDARGRFAEPHTGLTVPLGALDVRRYLKDAQAHENGELDVDAIFPDRLLRYPTHGPENRFNAILFIEQEGFEPLFRAARLAERYDLAIMSTKGMPVVACRRLADVLCGQHGIPLFVLHDFDKAGLSILGTLQDVEKETRKRYEFQHDIDVIDLGIRWQDIEDHGLESERVGYKVDPSNNLRQNGATDEEIEFLCGGSRDRQQGQRVELNAFTSDVFIEWIEAKLKEHGIEKVTPDAETLERTYRRATQMAIVRGQLDEIVEEAGEQAKEASLPKGLEGMIRRRLEKEPTRSWDEVVTELAGEALVAE